ncbi:hypothetical protein QJ857_gp0698 [Tupanvirus soda lake]|uniref:Uncharacterized protein n=2 Tax=Tupanvirus TaxID=2094720 RepID=A0A6N1NLA5_9VIRU|nr:hypothetical protein QJ857_gp0698 [Tupanvirus soda lake]QKU35349.1 hypothetical protein [Tupanvirus soda lake]
MGDYYTNSEYSPAVSTRYTDQPIVQPQVVQQQQAPNVVAPPQFLQQGPVANQRQYRYNNDTFNIDFKDIIKRGIKYLVEGLAVAFVAYYFIGRGRLDIKDIVMLGITAAFVFAILDTFSPTISLGARFGAGFGIGQGLFGLNPAIIGPGGVVAAAI